MARFPLAEWDPIPENETRPIIKPVGLVHHTAVSDAVKLRKNGDILWNFYLNEFGKIFQHLDTTRAPVAHRDGNHFPRGGVEFGFLAIECWDGAGRLWDGVKDTGAINCPPFNTAQFNMLVKLNVWLIETHKWPAKKADAPLGTGIGYHKQFTSTESPRWNKSHSCPGPKRTAQIPGLIEKVKAELEEKDMPVTDADVKRIAKAVWDQRLDPGPFAERVGGYEAGTTYPAGGLQIGGDAYGREVHREVVPRIAALETKVQEIDHQADERHKELIQAIQALATKLNALGG
ncbi:peptidoglycan recognition protein family protein [Flindersiella endophytica]